MKVSESMDRTLPFHSRLLIRIHLLMCKYCSRIKDQLFILRHASRFRGLPEDETNRTDCLSKDACERIKQAMRDYTVKNP